MPCGLSVTFLGKNRNGHVLGKHPLLDRTKLHVFVYGSNMLVSRMRDRIAAAAVVDTGYLVGRRLAFHKRGIDGSAKANAAFTGSEADRVWGVIYRIAHRDNVVLDRIESVGSGYDRDEVEVVTQDRCLPVYIYCARAEAIDESLRPYSWYHKLVLHGALQHASM